MRTPKPRPTRLAVLALPALLALQLPLRAIAADEQPHAAIDLEALRKDRAQKAERYRVAQRISRYLAAAAKEVDAEDPAEATRLLKKLRPNRLNPYERALVYRMLAHVAYGANQHEPAIEYFVKFLDEEVLPIRDEASVLWILRVDGLGGGGEVPRDARRHRIALRLLLPVLPQRVQVDRRARCLIRGDLPQRQLEPQQGQQGEQGESRLRGAHGLRLLQFEANPHADTVL